MQNLLAMMLNPEALTLDALQGTTTPGALPKGQATFDLDALLGQLPSANAPKAAPQGQIPFEPWLPVQTPNAFQGQPAPEQPPAGRPAAGQPQQPAIQGALQEQPLPGLDALLRQDTAQHTPVKSQPLPVSQQGLQHQLTPQPSPELEASLPEQPAKDQLHHELLLRKPAPTTATPLTLVGAPPPTQAAPQTAIVTASTDGPIFQGNEPAQPLPELVPTVPSDRSLRVQLGADLTVEIHAHDRTLDVILEGAADTVDPILAMSTELQADLEGSGFDLGEFTSRSEEEPSEEPGQDEQEEPRHSNEQGEGDAESTFSAGLAMHDGIIRLVA